MRLDAVHDAVLPAEVADGAQVNAPVLELRRVAEGVLPAVADRHRGLPLHFDDLGDDPEGVLTGSRPGAPVDDVAAEEIASPMRNWLISRGISPLARSGRFALLPPERTFSARPVASRQRSRTSMRACMFAGVGMTPP